MAEIRKLTPTLTGSAVAEAQLFISHSHKDREFVEETLIPALARQGISCWYSKESIKAAEDWESRIRAGLEQCEWFLVVLSSSAIESKWVKAEVAWALEHREGRVIPFVLEDCDSTELHLRLPTVQHADYSASGTTAISRIAKVIRKSDPPEFKPKERSWVWYSSYEGVKYGEISVLAIAETLVAAAVFLWVAAIWGTQHLVVSACIAPLLLLRTTESQRLGLRFADRSSTAVLAVFGWAEEIGLQRGRLLVPLMLLMIVLLFPAFLIGSVVAKTSATVWTVMTHPLKSAGSIPVNWSRHVLQVDSAYPEELVPGAHGNAHLHNVMWYSPRATVVGFLKESSGWERAFIATLVLGVMWIPAVVYRWSLKGSAFIYLPLLWVIRTTRTSNIYETLKNYRTLLIHKIALAFGLASIGLVLFRYLTTAPWNTMCEWLSENAPLMAEYVQPAAIPKWQAASALNGSLALILFLVADWVTRSTRKLAVDQAPWTFVFRSVWCLRTVLSIYSVLSLLYISASLIEHLPWPVLGEKWFPWS